MNNIRIQYSQRDDSKKEHPGAWHPLEEVIGSIPEVVANLVAQNNTPLGAYVEGEIYMVGYFADQATQAEIEALVNKEPEYFITLRRRVRNSEEWFVCPERPSTKEEILVYIRHQYVDMLISGDILTNVWMYGFRCPLEKRSACFEEVGISEPRFI